MNTFEYRIYYQWDGPSHSDPFASKKSSEQILEALRQFPNELGHRLEDLESQIGTSEVREGVNEVRLRIRTTDSLESVERALVATLKDWRLYGEALRPAH